jgi:CO dehydrogenase/acetyl-CoA synthase beta subunit
VSERDFDESVPDSEVKGSGGPVHHRAFYLEDEHFKLQAGSTIFRIHSFFFTRESDEARALVEQAGNSEDRPVKVKDVTAEDVERFCEVLYCRSVARTS